MKIDILTLFPKMFAGPFDESIIKRALDDQKVNINIINFRDYATDKHHTVDDKPFGGGAGMLLKIEPIYNALKHLDPKHKARRLLLSPQGKIFNQQTAQKLSSKKHLIFVCGHYEGFDQRIIDHLIDDQVSIGDYVLTGGELPAMIIADSVIRLIPGVIEPESLKHESHTIPNILEFPQYTRPASFKGWKVPDILLSGNHQEIKAWQEKNKSQK